MDKAAIRSNYIKRRQSMDRAAAVSKSTDIAQRVQDLVNWHNVSRAHIYRSQRKLNEVETAWFEAYFATIWPQIELTIGAVDKKAAMPSGQYDLIIVPLVAFDENRHRLGFGGGWYDRFLSSQPTAITIGLAYENQQHSASLPAERHDIRLDYIVTERRVIKP